MFVVGKSKNHSPSFSPGGGEGRGVVLRQRHGYVALGSHHMYEYLSHSVFKVGFLAHVYTFRCISRFSPLSCHDLSPRTMQTPKALAVTRGQHDDMKGNIHARRGSGLWSHEETLRSGRANPRQHPISNQQSLTKAIGNQHEERHFLLYHHFPKEMLFSTASEQKTDKRWQQQQQQPQ